MGRTKNKQKKRDQQSDQDISRIKFIRKDTVLKKNIISISVPRYCISNMKFIKDTWIRSEFNWVLTLNDPQKKVKKFHVLKCWMFSFEI
jgi:hypothetical protein